MFDWERRGFKERKHPWLCGPPAQRKEQDVVVLWCDPKSADTWLNETKDENGRREPKIQRRLYTLAYETKEEGGVS